MPEITAHHGLFRSTDLHVDDTGGPGRPVVLVHGWPLSGESFAHNVPALEAAGYRVITYDRRGFGRSDKPRTGYTYDTLAEDLATVLTELDLHDTTLVGFSMGGGEVVRYVTDQGPARLRSVVLASSVTPFMAQVPGNPDGPLPESQAAEMAAKLTADQESFYDEFTREFFSVDGVLKVSEEERRKALALCLQADKRAALECMAAFGHTDFRDDLAGIAEHGLPVLVLHGDGDATVPFEGSGRRTHEALPGSQLHVVAGAPHGVNVSHADEWNETLLDFLVR
ncbi:alpha/beta hydrolase [Actinotalea ferrariae]|uniref:alpha/beta fold hydrolase n=1 Tax=Actinotalea ferrariae TaxID=1386098 RepID=UPI001C8BCCD8|nr:alpha/beta hydrolase [Actinotalea ferrariae]MBX9244398.1 alpha/beta hydrolase [Actinotalea ferrariae]